MKNKIKRYYASLTTFQWLCKASQEYICKAISCPVIRETSILKWLHKVDKRAQRQRQTECVKDIPWHETTVQTLEPLERTDLTRILESLDERLRNICPSIRHAERAGSLEHLQVGKPNCREQSTWISHCPPVTTPSLWEKTHRCWRKIFLRVGIPIPY